jgi:hypothetical protein
MVRSTGNTSTALSSARKAKNDEFYTQLSDIEKEVYFYCNQLKGKTVFCNCDDPYESNFFKYFALNFNALGLKKLMATCYAGSPITNTELSLFDDGNPEEKAKRNPHKIEISEVTAGNPTDYRMADVDYLLKNKKNVLTRLKGDGDFRSPECIELMEQSDVVITNPPFSLFREFVAQLIKYEKKFLIIGNINAVTCKEIFKFIKENKIWLGESISSGDRKFRVPDHYPLDAAGCGFDEDGRRFIRVKGVRWFTNIQTKTSQRCEVLTLHKKYNAREYPQYDNYDTIEVAKVAEIPKDYDGKMGVPITFIDKYNPNQFEILGLDHHDPEKNGAQWHLLNGKATYRRLIIRRKTGA